MWLQSAYKGAGVGHATATSACSAVEQMLVGALSIFHTEFHSTFHLHESPAHGYDSIRHHLEFAVPLLVECLVGNHRGDELCSAHAAVERKIGTLLSSFHHQFLLLLSSFHHQFHSTVHLRSVQRRVRYLPRRRVSLYICVCMCVCARARTHTRVDTIARTIRPSCDCTLFAQSVSEHTTFSAPIRSP